VIHDKKKKRENDIHRLIMMRRQRDCNGDGEKLQEEMEKQQKL